MRLDASRLPPAQAGRPVRRPARQPVDRSRSLAQPASQPATTRATRLTSPRPSALARLPRPNPSSPAGNTVSLALACVVSLGVGRPLALWTARIEVVYGAFVLMVMALGVLNTLISSACASLADGEQLGGLFGVLDAVENLAGIFGPLLGGQLARLSPAAPLAVVVGCYAVNAALIAGWWASTLGVGAAAKKEA